MEANNFTYRGTEPLEVHNPVAQALTTIGRDRYNLEPQDFFASEYDLSEMFAADFYIKPCKVVLEVNARRAFYPYTGKENQKLQWKSKLIRQTHTLINLNSKTLDGLLEDKHNLEQSLRSMIGLYMAQ